MRKLSVLVACEFSGIVRDAFRRRGHGAVSCDLRPTEIPGPHYEGPIEDLLNNRFDWTWDLMIAFPPCTHLAVSGARWFPAKRKDGRQQMAINFFRMLTNVTQAHSVCIENPVGIMSTEYRKPTQIIQPWEFGHGETKATCLWLRNLPLLTPTNIVTGREHRIWRMAPGPERERERSRTYQGIAEAMAEQWGGLNSPRKDAQ